MEANLRSQSASNSLTTLQPDALLEHYDASYLDTINNLRLQEVNRAEVAKNSADTLSEVVQDELAKIHNHDGMTLTRFDQITSHWQTNINNAFQDGERDLQDLLKRAKLLTDDLKATRSRYGYYATSSVRMRFTITFAVIVTLLFAAILFTSGLVVQMLFWLVGAAAIIFFIPSSIRNRHQRIGLQQFLATQQELMSLQGRILEQRIKNAYNNQLKIMVEGALTMPQGKNRLQHLRDVLQVLHADLSMNTTNHPEVGIPRNIVHAPTAD